MKTQIKDVGDLEQKVEMKETPCVHHPERIVLMECTTCGCVSVCVTCIGTSHKGHMFRELEKSSSDTPWTILLRNAKGKLAPINQRLELIKGLNIQNEKESDLVINDIVKQGEIIKQEVERDCQQYIKQCKSVQAKNRQILIQAERNMRVYMSEMKEIISKCKAIGTAGSQSAVKALKDRLQIEIDRPFEKISDLQALGFTRHEHSNEASRRENTVGKIHLRKWDLEQSSTEDSTESLMGALAPINRATELYNVKIVSSFRHTTDKEIESMFAGFDGRSWVVCGGSTEARLVDGTGEYDPRRSINLDKYVYINDLVSSGDKKKTLICCSDCTVRELQHMDGRCRVLFHTRYYATSLCEAPEVGCVLVCHYYDGMLAKYNQKGRLLQTIDCDREGRRLFHSPASVRMNFNNGDIVVIESACPRNVVVVDRKLQVLCRYGGYEFQVSDNDKKTSNMFIPSDACFDKHGNIVIADSGNRNVILIDRYGNHTRVITRCDLEPRRIGVEPGGHLWVGYHDGTVKIIRYKSPSLRDSEKVD